MSLFYINSLPSLGSYWVVLHELMILPLFAARTCNKVEALLRKMAGYAEYRQKVKHRLLQGVC